MLDFVVTICAHRFITAETFFSLEKFRAQTRLLYLVTPIVGDALIARARSIACTHFIENDWAKYMVFIDDDIIFDPPHLEKLIADLKEGYDIVGGTYAVKDGSQIASYGWNGKTFLDGKVQEVEYLATGFMGISKKALIKMKDELPLPLLNPNDWARCYPFFECGSRPDRATCPIYISEDWDFCEKARKVGINSYLDTGIQLAHLGMKQYTCKDVYDHQVTQQAK